MTPPHTHKRQQQRLFCSFLMDLGNLAKVVWEMKVQEPTVYLREKNQGVGLVLSGTESFLRLG